MSTIITGTGQRTFTKLPGEVLDYGLNFSARMAGETVSAGQWGWYVPAGLSAIASGTASAATAQMIHVRLSAGSAGSAYLISGYARTTGSGRTLMGWFQLAIENPQ